MGLAQGLAVETRGLTKRYRTGVLAVADLNLQVRTGEVYGFLGPNGAGKTTTLRMLSGLLRPTSGSATVAGGVPGSPGSLARMGAMVETPAFYPYLSGRDNLRVVARYAGVPASRIEPVLQLVDLTDRARHKFRTYSTGMKQRLGVAAALLKEPELLILDEPTSGLDPQGTVEMRELIKELRHGGRTVLLSSHLLNEVELTCDRVGVIAKGKLVAEGTVDELRARSGGRALLVRATPVDQARRLLQSLLLPGQIQVRDGVFSLAVEPSQAAGINRRLVADGVDVSELRVSEQSLEDVFLQLTEQAPTLPAPASEYGWLTVQTILIQKPSRTAVLLGKLAMLAIVTLLISVVTLAATALTSYLLVTIDGTSSNWPSTTVLLKGFGALWLAFAVWTAFGMFLGVAFRSTAAAIGGGLTYLFVGEALLGQLLRNTEGVKEVLRFLPGVNAGAVNASFHLTFRSPDTATQLVDATRGTITLLAYLVAFTVLALLIFRRRDVGGS